MNHRRADFPFGGPSPLAGSADAANNVIEFNTPVFPANLLILARRLKASRNARDKFFRSSLFAEPAWDMMLALYIAEGEGCRLKVSDLCNESGVPNTTALRWIDQLVDLKMARKRRRPLDGRAFFVEIEPDTTRKMNGYLEKIWSRYFPLA